MSYLRAEEILPKEVLELIQQYIDGESIYIPRKEKRDWGSGTDTKNHKKYAAHASGKMRRK